MKTLLHFMPRLVAAALCTPLIISPLLANQSAAATAPEPSAIGTIAGFALLLLVILLPLLKKTTTRVTK